MFCDKYLFYAGEIVSRGIEAVDLVVSAAVVGLIEYEGEAVGSSSCSRSTSLRLVHVG